jgi:imidazolonepropionase-like amidohydrolase
MMRSAAAVIAVVIITACAPTRHVVTAGKADDFLIRDVTVIDGTGAAPQPHQDVVIQDGRIARIVEHGAPSGADQGVAFPPGLEVIDGRGLTLLPGFVDAHVHVGSDGAPRGVRGLGTEENLERLLRVGVTTAFDMSGNAATMRTLAERVDEGSLAGPRLKHTHLVITAKDGYPLALADELMDVPAWLVRLALPQVATTADIGPILDEIDDAGVDFVKIMVDRVPATEPMLDEPLLTALVKEARGRGHAVAVHAGHVDDAVIAARAGATMLAHLPRRGRFSAAQVQELKDSGVVIITTASMWETTADLLARRFTPTALDAHFVPAEILAAVQQPPDAAVIHTMRDDLVAARDDRAANLGALIAAGVPLAVGTDSPIPGTWPGSSYEKELSTLVAAGLEPMPLIMAMTSTPARLVPGSTFGVVREGVRADLVLVDGDPLQDPLTLSRPRHILLGGRIVTPMAPLPARPVAPSPSTASPPTGAPADSEALR